MDTSLMPKSIGKNPTKEDLLHIQQSFIQFNQARLLRIQSSLLVEQQKFLSLLPLLFHQNHANLPGYISNQTPSGISHYTPNKTTLALAKSYQKDFTDTVDKNHKYSLQGIYLMGSVSSLAFSEHSDIDVWLCHESHLSKHEKKLLQEKVNAIEIWAASLKLEVHIFLIDSSTFLKGKKTPLSAESSGEMQHYLLLEEFYRTAIYIAGRTPVWWLIPPEEEQNYTHYLSHLKKAKLINPHDFIDFGGLEDIPADEFIGSTLWHLYKSLNAPYKSLLKLLLMECYESEFPKPQWISLDLKRAIYQGDYELDDLDPYVLIYNKIDLYLQQSNNTERLNFARQCFYLKIMGGMESNPKPEKSHNRLALLKNISQKYQWDKNSLRALKENAAWDIKKASQENDLIIQQLKQYYLMVSRFAETNSLSSKNQDIQLIGRKLKSFLQKKPGKIDIITTRASIRCKSNELSLIESPPSLNRSVWSLYPGKVEQDNPANITPFKAESRTLIEVLTWLVSNDLYQQKLKLQIHSQHFFLSEESINNILTSIHNFLLKHRINITPSIQSFHYPNRMMTNLLLLNLGDTSLIKYKNTHFSNSINVFSYGKTQENFVKTIDQISISSWGEITTTRFIGLEGIFNCLIARFNLQSQPVHLQFTCDPSVQHTGITPAVEQLALKIDQLFGQQSRNISPRLIVAGEERFYLFQYTESGLGYTPIDTLTALITELSKPQVNFSPTHFGNAVLSDSPLPFLFSLSKENNLQIFFQTIGHHIHLYIIDEKGSLFYQCHYNTNFQQLLTSYATFLEILYNKGILSTELNIEYYELYSSNNYHYHVSPITPPQTFTWDYFNIRITGEIYESDMDIVYTLYCNDLEFFSVDANEDIFKSVAQHIYSLRQNNEKYPIHVTEIDVPMQALGVDNYTQLQSIHFLRYKQAMELRLNSAK